MRITELLTSVQSKLDRQNSTGRGVGNMKKLVMVGCNHIDPRLGARLEAVFQRYKPAAMTVEWSEDRAVHGNDAPMIAAPLRYAEAKKFRFIPSWVNTPLLAAAPS